MQLKGKGVECIIILLREKQLLDSIILAGKFDKEALEGGIMGWMPYKVRDFCQSSCVPTHCSHSYSDPVGLTVCE